MSTLILYQSKYGGAKQYATWLKESLSCDMLEVKDCRLGDLVDFDTLVFGGGVYAGSIAGISYLRKNYESLRHKRIAVFAVGASPADDKNTKALREANLPEAMGSLPLFYLRGALGVDKLTVPDKLLMRMLVGTVKKKSAEYRSPLENAILQASEKPCDWRERESLRSLVDDLSTPFTL